MLGVLDPAGIPLVILVVSGEIVELNYADGEIYEVEIDFINDGWSLADPLFGFACASRNGNTAGHSGKPD
jgi:hypothetical protein